MGKFGDKLKREANRIGKQVEKVVERAADQADAAVLRAQLDDERNRAKVALTSAEQATDEIQQLVGDIQSTFAAKTISKPTLEETAQLSEEVSAQFKLADDKFAIARGLQQALESAAQAVQLQLQIVRDNRGILSPSNNEPVPDHALEAGRVACAAAEQSASNIQTILIQARLDAENCKVALTEYHSLMTGGNPKAVNQFLAGKHQALQEQLRVTQEELARLKLAQQSASASSPASGENRGMLLQQQSANTTAVVATSESDPVVTRRRSLSGEYS